MSETVSMFDRACAAIDPMLGLGYHSEDLVRVVMEAMREPTEAVINAIRAVDYQIVELEPAEGDYLAAASLAWDGPRIAWQAGIDAVIARSSA